MPGIAPEYIGLRWRFSRISAWTARVRGRAPAERLLLDEAPRPEREGHRRIVALLRDARAVVDRVAMEARRRSRLEAAEPDAERGERGGEPARRRLADAPALRAPLSRVHQRVQEGARRDHDGVGFDALSRRDDDSRRACRSPRPPTSSDSAIPSRISRPGVDSSAARASEAYIAAIALRARTPDGRAARAVEDPELDAGGVGEAAHEPAEGVDLPHELPLGEAADRGVAGHPADRGGRRRQERRAPAHPRRGVRGLDPRVPAADDEDLVSHGGIVSQSGLAGSSRRESVTLQYKVLCTTLTAHDALPGRFAASSSSSPR